jgi:uncharacterized protein VirK/YbjX
VLCNVGLHFVAARVRSMKDAYFSPAIRLRANRVERAATLLRLWLSRPDLLWSILSIKGAPSKLRHKARWLDLTSRMLRPLCCIAWDVEHKVARIVDHYRVTSRLGGILTPNWSYDARQLIGVQEMGPQYSVKIDEPDWVTNDGLATISLWHGIDRMFALTFILSQEPGPLTAYVGGLQGRGTADAPQIYKQMTKDAHGMRPRDLTIEISRMFFKAIGVARIQAVAEMARNWNDRFADEEFHYIASLDYDRAWEERGGKRINSNWFRLPLDAQRREEQDIPARKRGLYRQRYAMLDAIEKSMIEAVARFVPGSNKTPSMPLPRPLTAGTQFRPTGNKTKVALLVLAATTFAWLAD